MAVLQVGLLILSWNVGFLQKKPVHFLSCIYKWMTSQWLNTLKNNRHLFSLFKKPQRKICFTHQFWLVLIELSREEGHDTKTSSFLSSERLILNSTGRGGGEGFFWSCILILNFNLHHKNLITVLLGFKENRAKYFMHATHYTCKARSLCVCNGFEGCLLN